MDRSRVREEGQPLVIEVGAWRDGENPTRPVDIGPFLKVFYGEIPAYAEAKQAMKTAWKRAAGIEEDDPPEPRQITEKRFSDLADVVTLSVNQPLPDNHGNLIVPYMCMHCDEKVEVAIKRDGEPVTVTIDIGLTKPLLLVVSKDWQPIQDTIFRKKKHINTAPGPQEDCVYIKGPTDAEGSIIGDPLEDELNVVMERRGTRGDGPITFAVKVPRDGFLVTVADTPLSTTQNDVLDAIFADAIPRDHHNRLEVASAFVEPSVVKTRT